MRDVLIGMFSILIFGGIAHQIFPVFWIIVIIAALVGALLQKSGATSFLMGFLGGALLWGIVAYRLGAANDWILVDRTAVLLQNIGRTGLILTTLLMSGILAGMGAMTGALGRNLFK